MQHVKALSIQQPWAWLIVNGYKDIENRDWRPRNPGLKFRGHVLIHTGKKADPDFNHEWLCEQFGLGVPKDLPYSGIVGDAVIEGCVTASESPWFFGPYGFVLRNARPLPFLPMKGALGFFGVDLPAGYLA